MKIKSYSYKNGVSLKSPRLKSLASLTSIAVESPDKVYIPTRQMKGSAPSVVVTKGDEVKIGSRLAVTGSDVIVSSVSGIVERIERMPSAFGGMNDVVVIENNHLETRETLEKLDLGSVTKDALITALKTVSIVDYDGETVIRKLEDIKSESPIVIVNLASDEPYQQTTASLMCEKMEDCILGVNAILKVTGATNVVIAVTKEDKPLYTEFINKIDSGLFDIDKSLMIVPTIYPIGDELELAKLLTKKKFKSVKESRGAGVVAFDLFTLYSLKRLLFDGETVDVRPISIIEKYETIKTTNAWIKIGSSLSDVASALMINGTGSVRKLVAGGLMRGIAQGNENIGWTQSLKSIVVVKDKMADLPSELPCITCGKCSKACPAGIVPYEIDFATINRDFNEARKLGAKGCTKCGCCSYICPSKRFLTQRIAYAKQTILDKGLNNE